MSQIVWSRKEIKQEARNAIGRAYGKAVLVSLILGICTGCVSTSFAKTARDRVSEYSATFVGTSGTWWTPGLVGLIFGAAFAAAVLPLLLQIFVGNPLEVGCETYLLQAARGGDVPGLGALKRGFETDYLGVVKTMFLKNLFVGLWSLLFVVPGVVKSYEYMMVPFLLSENPSMPADEALARSRDMMEGQKWNTFVLDLSFLGWVLLGMATFGIVTVLYTNPYVFLSRAALYNTLRDGQTVIDITPGQDRANS
jgi:uncharacterized membrane protein